MATSVPIKVGEVFDGPSKTLTDAHFLLFSGVTGDVHPVHYDVEYAKQSRFGKPVAHGLLLNSLVALGSAAFVIAVLATAALFAFLRGQDGQVFLTTTRRELIDIEPGAERQDFSVAGGAVTALRAL